MYDTRGVLHPLPSKHFIINFSHYDRYASLPLYSQSSSSSAQLSEFQGGSQAALLAFPRICDYRLSSRCVRTSPKKGGIRWTRAIQKRGNGASLLTGEHRLLRAGGRLPSPVGNDSGMKMPLKEQGRLACRGADTQVRPYINRLSVIARQRPKDTRAHGDFRPRHEHPPS